MSLAFLASLRLFSKKTVPEPTSLCFLKHLNQPEIPEGLDMYPILHFDKVRTTTKDPKTDEKDVRLKKT